jgi:hypothetical protein
VIINWQRTLCIIPSVVPFFHPLIFLCRLSLGVCSTLRDASGLLPASAFSKPCWATALWIEQSGTKYTGLCSTVAGGIETKRV